jgi:hypothetical protein
MRRLLGDGVRREKGRRRCWLQMQLCRTLELLLRLWRESVLSSSSVCMRQSGARRSCKIDCTQLKRLRELKCLRRILRQAQSQGGLNLKLGGLVRQQQRRLLVLRRELAADQTRTSRGSARQSHPGVRMQMRWSRFLRWTLMALRSQRHCRGRTRRQSRTLRQAQSQGGLNLKLGGLVRQQQRRLLRRELAADQSRARRGSARL